MKKTLLLITLGLMTTLVSNAQSAKNRMRIMAGVGFPNIPAAVLSDVDNSTGPYQLGYKVFLTDKFSIGLMYNYASAQTKNKLAYDDNLNPYTYNYEVRFSTFLTQFDYSWSNKENHNWYSGLSLGIVNVKATANITTGSGNPTFNAADGGLTYHATLVGWHGTIGKGFGGYAELGYGCNGLINLGATYSFH